MKYIVIGLLLLTLTVGFFLQVVPGYRTMKQAEQRLEEKKAAQDQVRAELIQLQQEIHDLEHESAAIEKVAREKFHYSKDDEEIFLYVEQ